MSWSHGPLWWLTFAGFLSGLFVLLFARLRRSEFKRGEAVGLALVALIQPAYADEEALHAAIIAFAAYAVSASAEAFVQRQDPRRIVMLGGSLAGAQLASPVWGTITMVVLPLALRKTLTAGDAARVVGLYMSLLFIPLLMTLSLLAISAEAPTPFASWPHLRSFGSGFRAAIPCAMLFGSLPLAAVCNSARTVRAKIAGLVCVLLAITGALSWLFGVGSSIIVLQFGAAIGALVVIAVSGWPPGTSRARNAASAICVTSAICWAGAAMAASSA